MNAIPSDLNKFTCDGFRAVYASSINEAASVFASRLARRKYGKAGYCGALKMESYASDYSFVSFSAFIGYVADRRFPNSTTGHNETFTVYTK